MGNRSVVARDLGRRAFESEEAQRGFLGLRQFCLTLLWWGYDTVFAKTHGLL